MWTFSVCVCVCVCVYTCNLLTDHITATHRSVRLSTHTSTQSPSLPAHTVSLMMCVCTMCVLASRTQERQTEYALKALRYLTNHYKLHSAQSNTRHSAYQHPGVLLVGHSMGGVVAKAVQLRAASDDTLGELV